MRCLVLGGGVVGEAVAWDLTQVAPTAEVTLADADRPRLEALAARMPLRVEPLDVTAAGLLERLAADHDVVVGALPSHLGYGVLERLCRQGVRMCDISFMPERASLLDAVARTHGACIVHDCGVAPGLSHVLVGAAVATLAKVTRVRLDVGGLPETPRPPFFYKAPFAPADVIEEYTRPVLVVRDGVPTAAEPLSEDERFDVAGVGALDSFLTDGLRSLVDTVTAETMEERTLRHPGHLPVMRALRDAGFFEAAPMSVGEVAVSPRALTSALLFPHWRYEAGERDLTVLRVDVTGEDAEGRPRHRSWTMVDRPDSASTGTLSSMARTTGFPAAIVARWLADGSFAEAGVHAPERLGLAGRASLLLEALRARGIEVIAD